MPSLKDEGVWSSQTEEWGRVTHLHTLLLGSHILQCFARSIDVAVHDGEFVPQFVL